jgi:branched-chain amino acid transport system substrate-binding protein
VRRRLLIGVLACAGLVAACTEGDVSTPATSIVVTTAPAPATTAPADTTADTTGDTSGTDGTAETVATDAATTTVASDGSVVSAWAGQPWAFGDVPASATPADESLDPVVIGMINQENSPVGSYPELRHAVEAAVAWVNAELGGVNGRPLQLETCITSFSVEQSQACAQQMVQAGAVAVISGIDITSTGSLPVLEQNGIPMISAIPTTLAEMKSANAFSFSGGITGAYLAFVADAHDQGLTSIAIAYGDFESFSVPATDYAAKVAENLGMDVTLIPFPITTTDFLPVIQSAIDSGAEAITVGTADTGCLPVLQTLHDFGFTGREYMVGACAANEILQQIPDEVQAAAIFSSEGPPDPGIEGNLFVDVTTRYSPDPAGGAGTVSFRAAMNLWSVMAGIDGDVTPTAIADALRAAVDAPSFWGHPFTCDGAQVPGLPALCSPQQTLFRLPDDSGTIVTETDDWVDVPALAASLG